MNKLVHIFLSILLVWSASGLHIAKHYCMGSLRDAGWYQVESCKVGEHTKANSEASPSSERQFQSIPCCEDELTWIQTNENLATVEVVSLPAPHYFSPNLLLPLKAAFEQEHSKLTDRAPPRMPAENIQVAFQVFRV